MDGLSLLAGSGLDYAAVVPVKRGLARPASSLPRR
jgi:hypothetical protein